MKSKDNSLTKLIKSGRIRNQLLMAATLRSELHSAAQRVIRLSDAGTPARFFTLVEVAEDSGLSSAAIVKEIIRLPGGTKKKERHER